MLSFVRSAFVRAAARAGGEARSADRRAEGEGKSAGGARSSAQASEGQQPGNRQHGATVSALVIRDSPICTHRLILSLASRTNEARERIEKLQDEIQQLNIDIEESQGRMRAKTFVVVVARC